MNLADKLRAMKSEQAVGDLAERLKAIDDRDYNFRQRLIMASDISEEDKVEKLKLAKEQDEFFKKMSEGKVSSKDIYGHSIKAIQGTPGGKVTMWGVKKAMMLANLIDNMAGQGLETALGDKEYKTYGEKWADYQYGGIGTFIKNKLPEEIRKNWGTEVELLGNILLSPTNIFFGVGAYTKTSQALRLLKMQRAMEKGGDLASALKLTTANKAGKSLKIAEAYNKVLSSIPEEKLVEELAKSLGTEQRVLFKVGHRFIPSPKRDIASLEIGAGKVADKTFETVAKLKQDLFQSKLGRLFTRYTGVDQVDDALRRGSYAAKGLENEVIPKIVDYKKDWDVLPENSKENILKLIENPDIDLGKIENILATKGTMVSKEEIGMAQRARMIGDDIRLAYKDADVHVPELGAGVSIEKNENLLKLINRINRITKGEEKTTVKGLKNYLNESSKLIKSDKRYIIKNFDRKIERLQGEINLLEKTLPHAERMKMITKEGEIPEHLSKIWRLIQNRRDNLDKILDARRRYMDINNQAIFLDRASTLKLNKFERKIDELLTGVDFRIQNKIDSDRWANVYKNKVKILEEAEQRIPNYLTHIFSDDALRELGKQTKEGFNRVLSEKNLSFYIRKYVDNDGVPLTTSEINAIESGKDIPKAQSFLDRFLGEPKEMAKLMETDVPTLLNLQLQRGMKSVKAGHYKMGIQQNFGKTLSELRDMGLTTEQIAKDYSGYTRYGWRKDLLYNNDMKRVIDMVEENYKRPGAAMRLFDRLTSWWKVNTTVLFPGYHIRNSIGNFWNNWLMGVNTPRPYQLAAKAQWLASHNKIDELSKIHLNNGMSLLEAVRQAQKNNVLGVGFYDVDIKSGKLLNTLYKPLTYVGETVENNARLALFFDSLEKLYSPFESGKRVAQALFDYKDFPVGVNRFFARVFPFYRWTAKNIPFQLQQMIENPQKIKTVMNIQQYVNEKIPDELFENLQSEYQKMGYRIKIGKQGNIVKNIDVAEWIPSLQAIKAITNVKNTITTMLNPMMKEPLEQYWNEEFGTGRKISPDAVAKKIVIQNPKTGEWEISGGFMNRIKFMLQNIRIFTTYQKLFNKQAHSKYQFLKLSEALNQAQKYVKEGDKIRPDDLLGIDKLYDKYGINERWQNVLENVFGIIPTEVYPAGAIIGYIKKYKYMLNELKAQVPKSIFNLLGQAAEWELQGNKKKADEIKSQIPEDSKKWINAYIVTINEMAKDLNAQYQLQQERRIQDAAKQRAYEDDEYKNLGNLEE